MYCSSCGSPVAAELSFCNRCGSNLGKEIAKVNQNNNAAGLLTGIVLLAIFGLGIMFAGAIALKKGGEMHEEIAGIFMFLAFLIVGTVEIFLLRQLSRVLGNTVKKDSTEKAPPLFQPANSLSARELHAAPAGTLAEPIPSVTENTTRTLAYSVKEPQR